MTFQSVPDGVEIVLNGTYNSIPLVNVFNVKDVATPSPARLAAIEALVFTWAQTYLLPLMSGGYFLNSITLTALTLSTGPQVQVFHSTGNQGTQTTAQIGANSAAVLSWRTANIGRSFRGRTYVGGLVVNELTDSQTISSAAIASLANAGTQLITTLQTLGVVLSVLSRVANKVARVTGILTEIVSVIVDTKLDSQRRRDAN